MIKQWKIAFANYLNLYACSKQEKPKFSWYYIIAQSTASLSHGVTPLCHAKSWLLEDARLLQLCTAENGQKNSVPVSFKDGDCFCTEFHDFSLGFTRGFCSFAPRDRQTKAFEKKIWTYSLGTLGTFKSCFYTLFLERNLLWLSV